MALSSGSSSASLLICTASESSRYYEALTAAVDKCGKSVGFELVVPLNATQRAAVCATCSAFALEVVEYGFASCTLVDGAAGEAVTMLQKMEERFPCWSAMPAPVVDGGSVTGASLLEMPQPAATNAPPASSMPDDESWWDSTPLTPAPDTAIHPAGSPPSWPPSSLVSSSASGPGDLSAATISGTLDSPQSSIPPDTGSSLPTSPTLASGNLYLFAIGVVALVAMVVASIAWHQRRRCELSSEDHDAIFSSVLSTEARWRRRRGDERSQVTGGGAGTDGAAPFQPAASTASVTDSFLLAHLGSVMLWEDDAELAAVRMPRAKVLGHVLLARGHSKEVHRGTYNGQSVVIEMLLPVNRKSAKHVNAFLTRVKLLAALHHERIVRFVGVAWDSLTDLCVVSEYMDGGDLHTALATFSSRERPRGFDADKVQLAIHIAEALAYLHEGSGRTKPILHQELTSKNVLLDSSLRNAKLTAMGSGYEDYNLQRQRLTWSGGEGGALSSPSPALWMAPEVLLGDKYDAKADVFSFGVVLSELDSHAMPYAHTPPRSNATSSVSSGASDGTTDSVAMLRMVAIGRLQLQWTPAAHREAPDVVALALQCAHVDPHERPWPVNIVQRLRDVLARLQACALQKSAPSGIVG